MQDKIINEIINRITGKNFQINSKIKLSSAQQYAFITLCRKKGKIISSTFLACNPLAIKIELKAVEKDLFSIDNVINLGESGLPLELPSEL